jgi:exodeoxyribonuclease-1
MWPAVFSRPDAEEARDVDEDLYGGFVGPDDRRRLNDLRVLPPETLAEKVADGRASFDDPRLGELLFRYRARNFTASLTPEEAARWEAHRAARLFDGVGGARTLEGLFTEIDALSEAADERGEEILGALYDYAEAIAPDRN